MYRIEYTSAAIAHLDRITQTDRKRIVRKIDLLANDPVPSGSKALKGFAGFHRIRVGDYRVVYVVRRRVITVTVAAVGHRSDIYAKIARLYKEPRS